MNWGLEDAIAASAIIVGTGALVAVVLRAFAGRSKRLLISAVVVLVAVLIWAHLAVGVF